MSDVKPWEQLGRREIADCRVFSVIEKTSKSPLDQQNHHFYLLESAAWVNIVPITPTGELVCIRQYRHGTEEITLEIPGGLVDPGEEPSRSAIRECLEETGYEAQSVESLGVLRPNPALFPNHLHTFVANNVSRVADIQNVSTEQTEVVLLPIAELPEALLSGRIDHALVVATLWRFLYQYPVESESGFK